MPSSRVRFFGLFFLSFFLFFFVESRGLGNLSLIYEDEKGKLGLPEMLQLQASALISLTKPALIALCGTPI